MKKQTVFIKVDVKNELPEYGKTVFGINDGGTVSFLVREAIDEEMNNPERKNDTDNTTHWLKPVPDVYVLSEEEYNSLMDEIKQQRKILDNYLDQNLQHNL